MDLKFNPLEHLETTMSKKADQYQNIRDSMNILFSEINIGITNQLDRSEKRNLIDKKFFDMLSDYENNFLNVITSVIDTTMKKSSYYTVSNWLNVIPDFIEKINENKKINISKLDTYHLLMKSEIIDFRDSIDEHNYLQISVSATQDSYDKRIKPRIEYMENCLATYEKRFGLVNKELFDKFYYEIKSKLETPIINAIEKIEKLAESAINDLEETFKFVVYEDNLLTTPIDDIRVKLNKNILSFFEKLRKRNYYIPVVDKFKLKYNNFIEKCIQSLIHERERVLENKLVIKNISETVFRNWSKIYDMLLKMDKKIIDIDCKYFFETNDKFQSHIYSIITKDSKYFKILYHYESDMFLKDFLMDVYSKRKVYTIDLKNMSSVSEYVVIPFVSDDIDMLFSNIFFEFANDINIKRIINTKATQLNLVCKSSELIIYNKETESVKAIMFQKMATFHKHIGQFMENDITRMTKKDIRKISKLTEFNKWINKKYNKRFIIDKKEIINMLLDNKKNKELEHLYKKFIFESRLMSDQICGVRVR